MFNKLFGIKYYRGALQIRLFGIKIYHNFVNLKNKCRLIPLGTFCYTRFVLTKLNLKPRKKDGELSFPFDLCVSSLESIAALLENGFKDFFDDISLLDSTALSWINTKYNLQFIHDHIDKETFITRYKKRINNLNKIIENAHYPIFISTVRYTANPEVANKIYSILEKKRQGKPFKYCILFLTDNKTSSSRRNELNSNIHWTELYTPNKEYLARWWDTSFVKTKENIELEDKLFEYIVNILNSSK